MTAGKVKSIEMTQRDPESSSPSRAFAQQPDVGLSAAGFDATSIPQIAGNLAVQQLFRSGHIQAKLEVSQPSDPDEQEADHVADQVMRMAEPAPIGTAPSTIQRKCAACEAGGATCPKCEEERTIQRKENPGQAAHANPPVHSQIAALRGGGQPLTPSARAFFEPRFGLDFSGVRVHADGQAAEAARTIEARAFTAGQDVVFGASEYLPEGREGKRLLAHELAHVVQQQDGSRSALLQRQTSQAPPPSPNVPNAPATSPDASDNVVEREGKAFDVAKGRVGQAAATVLFSNPVSPDTKDSPKMETFTVGEVIDRHSGEPARHGFDTQGPATAYTALMGGDVGGAVLQQDNFFFSAKLNKGSKKLRVTDPSVTEWDWWFGRDHVYRVTTLPGVASVTGMGGFVFPLGKDLMDDPAKTRFLKDPNVATPADAQSMRDIAGVPPIGQDGKTSSKLPDQVAIPEDRQEPFILAYFRSRGLEVLSYNEKETDRLAEVFKAAEPGSQTKDPSGVSAEAKKIIAADREHLKVYGKLLEEEAKVEALLSFLRVCEERGEFPPFYPVYVKPQKAQVVGLSAVMKGRQVDIQRRKIGLLAVSPVLGQLVGMPDPKSRFEEPRRVRGNLVEHLEIPKVRGTSYASLDESPLAKPATAENEEAIRKQFLTKLDAVRKAIRDTRSEMFSDPDFLLGMEGLRLLVTQDLSSITAKNAGMNAKLMALLRTHATNEKTWKEAEFVIQIGLLFIPGVGPLLSAAAGFAMSAAQMSTALRRWTASQASVNPATSMVDQQAAEAQLAQSTIDLTINSVFLAMEAINALKTMEASAGGKISSQHSSNWRRRKRNRSRPRVLPPAATYWKFPAEASSAVAQNHARSCASSSPLS